MFSAAFELLRPDCPEWGTAAVLQWDADIFGFAVADYRIGNAESVKSDPAGFRAALAQWANNNQVELISSSVLASDLEWCAILQEQGFKFVDYTVECVNKRIQSLEVFPTRNPVRLATPLDQSGVERLAEKAFRYGRYHADPRFPRELADLRYSWWVRNAFRMIGPDIPIYVTGESAYIKGFVQATVNGSDAHISIAAVEPTLQGGIIGYDLIGGALLDLKDRGVRRVTTKVSAANTAIMNIVVGFEGRFRPSQAVFHWHAPNAPHMLKTAR